MYYRKCKISDGKLTKHTGLLAVFITFIADGESGEILDLEASVVLGLTNRFIRMFFLEIAQPDVDPKIIER